MIIYSYCTRFQDVLADFKEKISRESTENKLIKIGVVKIVYIFFFNLSGNLSYCLHIHNVSADMFTGILYAFVYLGSLHRTLNHVLYLIHGGRLL